MPQNLDLPSTMQALVLDTAGKGYEGNKGFTLRQVPTPTLNEKANPQDADWVILRTIYGGVCGSDKGLWYRSAFGDLVTNALKKEHKEWRVPGHEFLGRVVALGSLAAQTSGLKPGDVVSAESHLYCGHCFQCKQGEQHVCENTQIMGFSCDGCFGEYIKLPANVLWPTNIKKIRPEVGAIQEPLGNAVHVCSTVDLQGKTVLVSGVGTIGLFAVLIAKSMGAKTIIGVDTDASKLEFAKQCGADQVLPLTIEKKADSYESSPALVEKIHALTNNIGVDVALEMAGFNVSLNNCIKATRRGGDIIMFGIKGGDFTIQNYSDVVLDGKRLHGVVGRRVFDTWRRTQQLLEGSVGTAHDIQQKIYDVILKGGEGSILPVKDFTPSRFEELLQKNIKLLVRFNNV